MAFALDANILLYASDKASPLHRSAAAFLKRCAEGQEVFCLAWPTVMAYLRIATHPSIFFAPLRIQEAVENIEALLALPHLRLLAEQEGFWPVYRRVIGHRSLRGNLLPDAHLAALLLQHGVRTLYTSDMDFRRFEFLDTKNPFST